MKRIALLLLTLATLQSCKKEALDTITDTPSFHELKGKMGIENNNIYRTASQDYIIVGYSASEFHLSKITVAGEEVWHKSYSFDGMVQAPALAVTEDGEFFIAGTLQPNGNSSTFPVVIKTNRNGHEKWRKVLENHENESTVAARITSDDDLVLVSHQELSGANQGTHVVRMDEEGTVEKEFDGPVWNPRGIWVTPQDRILMAGEKFADMPPKWKIFSLNGGLIEEHEAYTNDQHRTFATLLDHDGNLCFLDYTPGGPDYDMNWTVCNPDGSTANNHLIPNLVWPLGGGAIAKGTSGQKYVMGLLNAISNEDQFYIAVLNPDFTLHRIQYFPCDGGYPFATTIEVEPNGNLLISIDGAESQKFIRFTADLDFLL